VGRGKDPSGLIRDPERAKFVELPIANMRYFDSMPREEWLKHPFFGRRVNGNPWAAGQPEPVLQAFQEAIGVQA
jgi:hypothetical protein